MNQVSIIGNLVKDPELRVTQTGKTVCTFTVAVNLAWGANERTDYFRVATWGKTAETASKYLQKGGKVCIQGDVTISQYKGSDGKTYSNLDVNASFMELLGGPRRSDADDSGLSYNPGSKTVGEQGGFVRVDPGDDLPF